MTWHIYHANQLNQFSNQWDDLNEKSINSPLLTSAFLISALRILGKGDEKLFCLGNPSNPTCMAILAESKRGAWETFQPSQAPIGAWLIAPELEPIETFNMLLRAIPGMPMVLGITQQDPLHHPRPSDSNNISTIDYIETARILIEGSFDDYWEQRGKNLRQNMRTARNRLERAGLNPRLECLTEPAQMKQAVIDYARMENSGWKAENGTAVSADDAQGKFYTDLLEHHCTLGRGRVYKLLFNDQVAAMDLCIHLNNEIVILKTTYDTTLSEYSPAMMLHQLIIQDIFKSKEFVKIEFYGKLMDWQIRLTGDIRRMYHVNVYRWKWLKRLK